LVSPTLCATNLYQTGGRILNFYKLCHFLLYSEKSPLLITLGLFDIDNSIHAEVFWVILDVAQVFVAHGTGFSMVMSISGFAKKRMRKKIQGPFTLV